ncbi:MAG: cobalamin-dependent protein [Spirochaetales bacterium]|nr:cobalamin-dependent protein [Spirochaetales bacterium]
MKVLFLTPPLKDYAHYGDNVIPYTEYAMYAAFLQREIKGIEVDILECPAHRITMQQLPAELKKQSPDIVVIGILYAPQSIEVNEGFKMVKQYNEQIITIAEGPHFGAIPKETLESNPHIDFVIVGEAELTLCETVRFIMEEKTEFGDIDGLVYRKGNEIVINSPRELINNLDDLPTPAYHLMHLEKNLYYQFNTLDHYIRLYSSRGCKGRCIFCHRWPQYKGRYRTKSGHKMAMEVLYLYERYGINAFDIYDADFGEDPLMVRNFCTALVESGAGAELNIWFDTRADNIILWEKHRLLPLLKKAGVRLCALGVEYFTDDSLNTMGKKTTVSDITTAFHILKKHNIPNGALAIMGWPEETRETAYALYHFVEKELDPDVFVLQMLQPLPGTILWNKLKNDKTLEADYKFYNRFYPVISTKYLSRQELGGIYKELLNRFYTDTSKFTYLLEHENRLVRAAASYFVEKLTPAKEKVSA